MTTATVEFKALPAVAELHTPNLTEAERDALLDCINGVRSGEKQYLVLLTNRKVRNSAGEYLHGQKRVPGEDYDPCAALTPDAHLGWMSKAPTNKANEVYIYVYDEARALAGENGHTNVTMVGIRSFRVLAERPGPLAESAPQLQQEQPAPQQFGPQFDPRLLMAQSMFLMAQALTVQAAALTAQAAQPIHSSL